MLQGVNLCRRSFAYGRGATFGVGVNGSGSIGGRGGTIVGYGDTVGGRGGTSIHQGVLVGVSVGANVPVGVEVEGRANLRRA